MATITQLVFNNIRLNYSLPEIIAYEKKTIGDKKDAKEGEFESLKKQLKLNIKKMQSTNSDCPQGDVHF